MLLLNFVLYTSIKIVVMETVQHKSSTSLIPEKDRCYIACESNEMFCTQ
jgi:hypothetical protein